MILKDKVILVTGSSRGIGKEIALLAAKEGAKVIVNYVNNEGAAKDVVDAIMKNGGEAISIQADISKADDIERMFVETLKHFGTLDVVINNAGTHSPRSSWELTWEDWEKVLKTNVIGTFMCSRNAARIFMEKQSGVIVNIASVRGLFYCGRVGNLDYSAAKSAVLSMTVTLSKELAPHIRVNAIAPGPTDTDLTASWDNQTKACAIDESLMKRLMKPVEIANGAIFLASDMASGITGEVMVIDGGYSLK